jgi:hypothetical protein
MVLSEAEQASHDLGAEAAGRLEAGGARGRRKRGRDIPELERPDESCVELDGRHGRLGIGGRRGEGAGEPAHELLQLAARELVVGAERLHVRRHQALLHDEPDLLLRPGRGHRRGGDGHGRERAGQDEDGEERTAHSGHAIGRAARPL